MIIASKFITPVSRFVVTNKASISLGVAMAGVIFTGIASGKAALEADKVLKEIDEPMTKKQMIFAVGPKLLPPIVIGGGTIGLMWLTHRFDLKAQAALAGALALSEARNAEFIEKATDILGEKKVKEVDKKIVEDRITKSSDDILVFDEDGDLYFDKWLGMKLRTTELALSAAAGKVAMQMYAGSDSTIEDFYTYLSEGSNVKCPTLGENSRCFGWRASYDDAPQIHVWDTIRINETAYTVFEYDENFLG